MKIKSNIFAAAAVLFFVFSGASAVFGQQNIPMTGAYGKADVKDADVVAAANFAVKTQSKTQKATIKLVSINAAQTQVVAGMNYEICMEVSVKKKSGKTAVRQLVTAVVFRGLKNKYSLTSWTPAPQGSTCESN